jgi:hypothetical protein
MPCRSSISSFQTSTRPLYSLTIPPESTDDATTGDLNILADMSIVGMGRDQTIIDASGIVPIRDRAIRIGTYVDPPSNPPRLGFHVAISGVTIRGGQATD